MGKKQLETVYISSSSVMDKIFEQFGYKGKQRNRQEGGRRESRLKSCWFFGGLREITLMGTIQKNSPKLLTQGKERIDKSMSQEAKGNGIQCKSRKIWLSRSTYNTAIITLGKYVATIRRWKILVNRKLILRGEPLKILSWLLQFSQWNGMQGWEREWGFKRRQSVKQ